MYNLITFDRNRNRTEQKFNSYCEVFLAYEKSIAHETWITSAAGSIIIAKNNSARYQRNGKKGKLI